MKEWVILDKAKKYSEKRWNYLSPTTIIDYTAGFKAALEMMEKNKVKNLAQPDVSRQLPSVYDLDIQMLRNTATDAEFRRKIQQWLEGNFG